MKNKNETVVPARSAGRPSTFPAGTELVAFPSKIPAETRDQLRELASNRKSPFDLTHNSIGAEVARIVGQAHARFIKDRDRTAARRSTTTATEEAAG